VAPQAAPLVPPLAPPDPSLEARAVTVSYGNRIVLDAVHFAVPAGSFLGLLGPNGSGKTTLLRLLTGALQPTLGQVFLEGRPLSGIRRQDVARRIGVVPQTFNLDFKFTVEEVVALGRYPHTGAWNKGVSAGDPAVEAALDALSIRELADRTVTELSGGERQRVLIAQTLAQETRLILLDEPLNNLDLNHQLEVMQVLSGLHAQGKTIVVVLHDINMAAQYCRELAVLAEGRIAARGTPDRLLTPALLLEVFGIRVAVHREGGRPYITPLTPASAPRARGASEYHVHVITGGGAAVGILDELVRRGFTPSVGVVSVFDSDYETARGYGLDVVSAPPFQPLPPEAILEERAMAAQAECLVVAPQVYGPGNLAGLEVAAEAARRGACVLVIQDPPIAGRDLCGGRAAVLEQEVLAAGGILVAGDAPLLSEICERAGRHEPSGEEDAPCG
jgi:iron complex transport system ATP-binding protein